MGGATRFFVLLTTPFPLLHHRGPPLLRLSRHHKLLSFSHFHNLTCSPSHPPYLPSSPIKASQHLHNQAASSLHFGDSSPGADSRFSVSPQHSHPWPEWSRFINYISANDYFENRPGLDASGAQGIGGEDEFVAASELPQQFLCEARACLAFAHDRQNLLRLLSRRDIEVVVEHGTPFLFRNAEDLVGKMKSFISNTESSVLDTERAHMVELMKFMLSYASNPLVCLESYNLYNRNTVESSIRNLFAELCKLCYNAPAPGRANISGSVQNQMPGNFEQTMPSGQKIEMKRGDWICPRCNFMNFARNFRCLKCEEARPKRQLTGREWECPQCDFYNYGRNMTCMRCDCKRPGQISLGATSTMSTMGHGNGSNTNTSDVASRLAVNEEKAKRWFRKVSQLDGTADINSLEADEDFPEIMPLRKGVNRFVVSTRKTPLERRLANSQYRRNLANDGTSKVDNFQAWEMTKSPDTPISQNLGHQIGLAQSDNSIAAGHNSSTASLPSISINSSQSRDVKESNSIHVPFVPLRADMFAQKSDSMKTEESEKAVSHTDAGSTNRGGSSQLSSKSTSQFSSEDKEKEQAEKSERWFKKIAELDDVSDLTSAIPNEDFPEIMPMRQGENQFVLSKKKDRSLTSPAYKRRLAMEQAGNTKFVPFVPFPPDYFAKKDKQQSDGANLINKENIESSSSEEAEKLPKMSVDARPSSLNGDYVRSMTNVETSSRVPERFPEVLDNANHVSTRGDCVQEIGNQDVSLESWSQEPSGRSSINSNMGDIYEAKTSGNLSQSFVSSQIDNQEGLGNENSGAENKDHMPNLTGSSSLPSENQNIRERRTGLNLEGSAVKEPDPLDMSEEAKAERWFRRVSQIKDISELSQIPDEDFPSIMPMRKGVNRFVVSKRKTPLERRLTSQQYKRNLPIVSSDPIKKEDEGS